MPRDKQVKSMHFDQLLEIKKKMEAEIDARIGEERRRLMASLKRLDDISAHSKKLPLGSPTSVTRRTLVPKYRNPINHNETWAGRGLKPRWLVAAMKNGKKKLSDFLIQD